MPASAKDASRDQGEVRDTIAEGLADCRETMSRRAEVGIDFAVVTRKLEQQGVEAFASDYEKLLNSIAGKRAQVPRAAGPS